MQPSMAVASPSPNLQRQYSSPLQSCAVAAPPPVSPEELGAALTEAIFRGVALWNSGDHAGCAAVLMQAAEQFAQVEPRLATAVQCCKGKSTGPSLDSQGWILRSVMDEVLADLRSRQQQAASARVIRPQALQQLQLSFPQLSVSQVEAALRRCGGDEARASEILTQVQPAAVTTPRPEPPRLVPAPPTGTPRRPPVQPNRFRKPSSESHSATPEFGVSPERSSWGSMPDRPARPPDFVLDTEGWFRHQDPSGQGMELEEVIGHLHNLYRSFVAKNIIEDLVRRAWPRGSVKMRAPDFMAPGGVRELLLARLGEPDLPGRSDNQKLSPSPPLGARGLPAARPSTPPRSKFAQRLNDATRFSALSSKPENEPVQPKSFQPRQFQVDGEAAQPKSVQPQRQYHAAGEVSQPKGFQPQKLYNIDGEAVQPKFFQPQRPWTPPPSSSLGRRPFSASYFTPRLASTMPAGSLLPDRRNDGGNLQFADMPIASQLSARTNVSFSERWTPSVVLQQSGGFLRQESFGVSRPESALFRPESALFRPESGFLRQESGGGRFQRQESGSKYVAALPSVNKGSVSSSVPRRKAVLVGINYVGSPAELKGCINDVQNMYQFLTDKLGWSFSSIRVLTDDNPSAMPTRSNILASLQWLAADARPGDVLFFHFSGHGAQQRDSHGFEEDGMNETILPCDFSKNGMISDDLIGELLIRRLPENSRLTSVMDCCHSGTGLDLPFTWSSRGWQEETNPYHVAADVQLISGVEDGDTPADANALYGAAGGALTTAFCDLLREHPCCTYPELVSHLNQILRMRGFSQKAQLTAAQRFDFERPFTLTDITSNSNSNLGRTFRRKFPPRPRKYVGPLKEALKSSASVLGGLMLTDTATWLGASAIPALVGG